MKSSRLQATALLFALPISTGGSRGDRLHVFRQCTELVRQNCLEPDTAKVSVTAQPAWPETVDAHDLAASTTWLRLPD